jgi:hypothetical protein
MAPVVANSNQSQQPQQTYGSTQPGSTDQAVQQQSRPRGQAYADDDPGAGSSQDEANARGWYSYDQYRQSNRRNAPRAQDANQPARAYPGAAQYQNQAPPSEYMDGPDGSDAQRHRGEDRPTRTYLRQQPAYADGDDDPNAPARYRRYVPTAPPYGRAVPGPAYGGGPNADQ